MIMIRVLEVSDLGKVMDLMFQREHYFGINLAKEKWAVSAVLTNLEDALRDSRWYFLGKFDSEGNLSSMMAQYLAETYPVWRLSWAIVSLEKTRIYNLSDTGYLDLLDTLIQRAEDHKIYTFYSCMLTKDVQGRFKALTRSLRNKEQSLLCSYVAHEWWKGLKLEAPSAVSALLGPVSVTEDCTVHQWVRIIPAYSPSEATYNLSQKTQRKSECLMNLRLQS